LDPFGNEKGKIFFFGRSFEKLDINVGNKLFRGNFREQINDDIGNGAIMDEGGQDVDLEL
jgi:hypothetical protein